MINFKAFKGLHAKEENIQDFPIYTPDQYTEEEITKKLKDRKISYVDLIRPTFFRGESPIKNRFKKVIKRFEDYLSEYLIKDPESIYIYEQKKGNGHIFRGVIGLLSVNNYLDGDIKKHESVIEEKKNVAKLFLDIVKIHSQPILLTYEDTNTKIGLLMDLEMKSKSLFHFTDEYGISHRLWQVDNRLRIGQFKDAVEGLPALYIADGHHRMESSVEHYEEIKNKTKSRSFLLDPSQYIMSFIMPNSSLKLYAYNKMLKDLNGLSKQELLNKLEKYFTINLKYKEPYFPSHKHHICMYLDGEFYGLYIKYELRGTPEGLGDLDMYLFDKLILEPIFEINTNSKSDKIEFVRGTGDIKGIVDMKNRVDNEGYAVGFGFYPMNFNDMKLIADLGLTMPPKSTFIEPKLLSGLIMYDMNKNHF